MSPRVRSSSAVLLVLTLFACADEKPPAPDPQPRKQRASASESASTDGAVLDPSRDQFVLTYAGERGAFADCNAVDEVPENARGAVGVNVYGKRPPAGTVWVCNLDKPRDDGGFALRAVARDEFEDVILDGRSSTVELPEGLELPDVDPAPAGGPIIVYKTEWCGVCKQLESYLKRKGVEYVTKDIEADSSAAAELAAKAERAGVPMGSVPMIDVGGELLRGFDRARLEALL